MIVFNRPCITTTRETSHTAKSSRDSVPSLDTTPPQLLFPISFKKQVVLFLLRLLRFQKEAVGIDDLNRDIKIDSTPYKKPASEKFAIRLSSLLKDKMSVNSSTIIGPLGTYPYYMLAAFFFTGSVILFRHWPLKKGTMDCLPLPPGPKSYPLIGNLFDMPVGRKPWVVFDEWRKTHGKTFISMALGCRH